MFWLVHGLFCESSYQIIVRFGMLSATYSLHDRLHASLAEISNMINELLSCTPQGKCFSPLRKRRYEILQCLIAHDPGTLGVLANPVAAACMLSKVQLKAS